MRAFIRIALCILLATVSLQASAREPNAEEAIETSADRLSMPASTDGTLVIGRCVKCAPTTLYASAATQYTIGRKSVTLQEFATFIRANPTAAVGVMYETTTKRVLRVQA